MPISIRVWRSPAPPRSFSLGGSHSTWISVLSSIMTVFGMKEPCVLLDESWVVINSVELLNRCPEAILVPSCVRNVTVSFDHHSMVAVAPCTRFAVPHDATMNEIYATLTRGVVIDLSSTADVLISVRGRFDSTSCILKDVDELVEGDALTLFRGCSNNITVTLMEGGIVRTSAQVCVPADASYLCLLQQIRTSLSLHPATPLTVTRSDGYLLRLDDLPCCLQPREALRVEVVWDVEMRDRFGVSPLPATPAAAASPVGQQPAQQPAPKIIIAPTTHRSTAAAVDLTISDDAISISESDDEVVFVVSNRIPSPKRRKPQDATP